jgi:hypothetical protein
VASKAAGSGPAAGHDDESFLSAGDTERGGRSFGAGMDLLHERCHRVRLQQRSMHCSLDTEYVINQPINRQGETAWILRIRLPGDGDQVRHAVASSLHVPNACR